MNSTKTSVKPLEVVIVGAGFAGLACAKELAKLNKEHEGRLITVKLIDKNPYQVFSPLLYQVATGGLPEDDIAYPIRASIDGVTFIRGEVVKVSTKNNTIRLSDGVVIPYHHLVLATGSIGTCFGIPGAAENSLQMKNIIEARNIRKQLLKTYEDVELGKKSKEILAVIIVGGGPTGVELSGAVAELQKNMAKEYPDLVQYSSITLVEAGEAILPSFMRKNSIKATKALEKLGVVVKVKSAVEKMYEGTIVLKNGEVLHGGTIIWAGGVAGQEKWGDLGDTDRLNRLKVDKNLRIRENVWVIGDGSSFTVENKKTLPMVAPVALQMGRHVANQLTNIALGKPLIDYVYKNKGQMATIGRGAAVVETPQGLSLHGLVAWIAWLLLHVAYLAGGRNKVSVLADWAWNYIAWHKGPRRAVLD